MELLLNFSDTSFNTKVGTIHLYMYWTNSQQFVFSYTVILIIHSSYVLESSYEPELVSIEFLPLRKK